MADTHPHATSLDAIGKPLVTSHYNISDRAWQKWRRYGVPVIHWKSLALLAQVNGKPLPAWGNEA